MYYSVVFENMQANVFYISQVFSNVQSVYHSLYNNQINAHALIGQSAVGYCAGKPTEKSGVFWIII